MCVLECLVLSAPTFMQIMVGGMSMSVKPFYLSLYHD